MRLQACLLALALVVSSATAHAQWVWRDASGRVTASDRPPPPDIADKNVLQRPGPARQAAAPALSASAAASAALPPPPALDAELQARRKAAAQQQAAKEKSEADQLATQRGENCNRARGQMAALEGGQRIARFNDKGEREVLDDKSRADETRRVRQVMSTDCR